MNGASAAISINAYGVSVRLESGNAALLEELKEDFAFFAAPELREPDIKICAHMGPPDLGLLKKAGKILKTSKWTVFRTSSGTRVVQYPEGLTCEYDYGRETGRLCCEDPALMREIAYLLILSRLGEKLDLKGLHRVHAMAAEFEGAGLLMTAPMGGGKTTLLMQLARDPAFTLLADDTPLVDSRGDIHPFPLRMGLAGGSPFLKDFPKDKLRLLKRRHYAPKYLISPLFPGGNIQGKTRCRRLFLLKRSGGAPRIKKAGITRAAFELLNSLVMGTGVPQIAEYFLRPELSDFPAKARIILGRSAAALALLRNCGAFCFYLSTEPELNARALKLFLSRKRAGNDDSSCRTK